LPAAPRLARYPAEAHHATPLRFEALTAALVWDSAIAAAVAAFLAALLLTFSARSLRAVRSGRRSPGWPNAVGALVLLVFALLPPGGGTQADDGSATAQPAASHPGADAAIERFHLIPR
jgi:hypothetical protein